MEQPTKFSSAEILEQLNRILSSPEFQNSQVLSGFLEYAVNETIEGRAKELKEYNIAVNVLSRKPDFNPQFDAIVRIHAGRLRRALREYYHTPARNDKIIVSMPKGSYAIAFEENPDFAPQPAPSNENTSGFQEKITVAVLPFRNIGDSAHDFFAEGLGEQLSIELARYDIYRVIAYYSSIYAASQTGDIKDLGNILGTRYILTGSVQRNRNRLNVYAQLIDSGTSEQLWVHSYQKKNIGKDLLELQDEIVQAVVNKTAGYYGAIFRSTVKLPGKANDDIKIHDAVFYYYHYKNKFTNETFQKARKALGYAVKADPEHALAWALLGEIYGDSYVMRFDSVAHPLERGMDCVRKAIKADVSCQHAYQALTWLSMLLHNKPEALKAIEQCVDINPNSMFTIGSMGFALICLGEFERGIVLLKESVQYNPFSPWWFNLGFSLYYFYKGQYQDAFYYAEKMYMLQVPWDALLKASSLSKMDRVEEAAVYIPGLVRSISETGLSVREYIGVFIFSEELINELHDGLVMAGFEYQTT